MGFSARRRALLSIGVAGLGLAAGCTGFSPRAPFGKDGFFGWHVEAPYDTSDVKTVFVFIKTQSFRRDIQQTLTEAIEKEIDLRTPYKVVGDPKKADSILKATITFADKNLMVEAPTNLPRQLNATISVWVNWTHNPPTDVEKTQLPTMVGQTDYFVPEVGETSLTIFYSICQDLAKQIVDMMERPWFTDEDLK